VFIISALLLIHILLFIVRLWKYAFYKEQPVEENKKSENVVEYKDTTEEDEEEIANYS
jgi:hypothetical protein